MATPKALICMTVILAMVYLMDIHGQNHSMGIYFEVKRNVIQDSGSVLCLNAAFVISAHN